MPDNDDQDDVQGSVHPFPTPRERVDRMGHHLDEPDEPVDLAAVQADDDMINALATGTSVLAGGGYRADDQVVALLSAWRAEVTAEPIPELVGIDTAVAAVRSGTRSARHIRSRRSAKGRHLAPVAAAAALLVVVGGGVSVGSATAQPDSPLWPVSEMLYKERAVSVQAADRASTKIESAKQALTKGQSDVAATELAQAQQDLGAVRPQEGQKQLSDVKSFLVAKAAETPSGTSVDPATPLRTDKTRPIPAGAALSQQPTATGTLSPTPTESETPSTTTAPASSRPGRSTSAHPTVKPTTVATQPPPTTPATLTDSAGATAPPGTTAPIKGATSSKPAPVTSDLDVSPITDAP